MTTDTAYTVELIQKGLTLFDQSLPESADGAGVHRSDPAQEAPVAVAALQTSAQGKGLSGMTTDTAYTVELIQKGLTLFDRERAKMV